MKHWLFLSTLLLSFSSYACRTSHSDIALNNLIEIIYLEERGTFSVRLPARLYPTSQKDAVLYLKFNSVQGGKISSTLTQEITVSNNSGLLVGNFYVEGVDGYEPFLEAYWWPPKGEMCASTGIKKLRVLP